MIQLRTVVLVLGALLYVGTVVVAVVGDPALDLGSIYLVTGGPIYALVGIIILAHRPGHRLGRILLVVGVALTITVFGPVILEALTPLRWTIRPIRGLLETIIEWSGSIALLCGTVLALVWFPDGRATSRLGRVIEGASAVFVAGAIVSAIAGQGEAAGNVALGVAIVLYALSVVELGRRTARAEPRQRASLLWVLGSAVILTTFMVGVLVLGDRVPVLWNLWIASTVLPAIAVAVAISRHHLYDIDRLVSRSIAYTLVTVILVAVFGALVIGIATVGGGVLAFLVLPPLQGGETMTVAVATLVVATLFAPLRSRVQTMVDRRFDRSAYDAARTVEAYAGRLRDELDLSTLTSELQRVTSGTFQPTDAAVWLRDRRSTG